MAELTTKVDVKTYLGITGIELDSLITSLISRMSQFVESFTGRIFTAQDFVEQECGRAPDVRRVAREDFIQHGAERVDVRSWSDVPGLPPNLFRRHV